MAGASLYRTTASDVAPMTSAAAVYVGVPRVYMGVCIQGWSTRVRAYACIYGLRLRFTGTGSRFRIMETGFRFRIWKPGSALVYGSPGYALV